jgi:hypothetical protein
MRTRSPNAAFRPLVWLVLSSFLLQPLLPAADAWASIRSEEASSFGRARLVAPAQGEHLAAGAVRFAYDLPHDGAKSTLIVSRTPFDPSGWTSIPEDEGFVLAEATADIRSLDGLGLSIANETELYWAVATQDRSRGRLHVSEVRSFIAEPKFTNRIAPNALLGPTKIGTLTRAEQEAAWAEMRAANLALDAQAGKLPANATAAAGAPRIRLSAGFDFAPAVEIPRVPEALSMSRTRPGAEAGAAGMGSYLVQFAEPPGAAQLDAIAEAGGATFTYIPDQAYLVRMSPDAHAKLVAGGRASWVGDFEPAFKLSPLIGETSLAQTGKYLALVFPDAKVQEVAAEMTARGYSVENVTDNGINKMIRFRAGETALGDAATLAAVAWVEPVIQSYADNANAQWVTQTGSTNVRRIWLAGLQGQNQVVMTSDSGIHMTHNMFSDPGLPVTTFGDYPTHRKVIAYKAGSTDPNVVFGDHAGANSNHGSHTAGTMVGNDSVNAGVSLHDGMAKEAKIFFMDLSGPAVANAVLPPDDLNDLHNPPYLGNAGGAARMSSNSWGAAVQGAYTLNSLALDQFTYNHKDYYIAHSNGNSGSAGSVGAPATAKNVVGSGGTGNNTLQNSIYASTSRGPTADQRRKPLFATPGQSVTSAQAAPATYGSLSGTSMSCPSGTGAMTLARQYLTDGWYPTGQPVPANGFTPTSALLRAMAVNAAENTVTSFTAPDNNVGWGRMKLDSLLYLPGDTRKLLLVDQTDGLQQAQFAEYQVNVTEGTIAFEVSLAWTDYPGNPVVAVQLVNNLDLTVTNGVVTYRGNVFSGGNSTTGGSFDVRNVEENVRVAAPAPGLWTIRVTGTAVPIGPQPFALCITGGIGQAAGALALDRIEYGSSSTVEIQVTDTNAAGVQVNLASNTEPAGETVTLAGGDGVWTGTFPLTILGATNGDGFLSVSNGDQITATYLDASPAATLIAKANVSLASPVITNVDADPRGPAGTFVNFATNLNAVGKVYYGTTPALELGSVSAPGARLAHSILLPNIAEGTLYYYDVEATALNGNQARDDRGGAHYTFTGKKKADILLVTSETEGPFPRIQTWTDALGGNGYDYEIWEGALAQTPPLGDRNTGFRSYQAVIWQSGLEAYPPVSDPAAQTITDYLNGGGRLWMMGHDLGWAFADPTSPVYTPVRAAWLLNTLHTQWLADPASWSNQFGTASDPISGAYTGGVTYLPFRSGGAGDEIAVVNGTGTGSHTWTNDELSPAPTGMRWENGVPNGSALTALWGGAPSRLVADYFELSSMAPPFTIPSGIRNDIVNKALVWLFGRPRPAVAVTSPNGGEVITTTSTNITWNETIGLGYNAAQRTIEYSLDGGDSWITITTSAGASPYAWDLSLVPNSVKALVRVRVVDDGTPAPLSMTDASNAVFTIAHTGGDLAGPVVVAGSITSSPNPIVRPNPAVLNATVSDVNTGGSGVAAAEWSIGGSPAAAGGGTAMTGAFGGNTVAVSINLDTTPFNPGPRTLWVRGQDGAGNWGDAEPLNLQVNGPEPVGAPIVPTIAFLSQNAPNPFLGNTIVRYGLPQDGRVELAVYGVSGQLVKRLASGSLPAGEHTAVWDGKDEAGRQVPAGLYFYKMNFAGEQFVKKAMVLAH